MLTIKTTISFAYSILKTSYKNNGDGGDLQTLFILKKSRVNPRKEVWTYKDVAFPQDSVGTH